MFQVSSDTASDCLNGFRIYNIYHIRMDNNTTDITFLSKFCRIFCGFQDRNFI